jgi:FMN phosphatase YigB (HAD superfamily)
MEPDKIVLFDLDGTLREPRSDERECHEAHVQAVITVLGKLPRRSLKVIRWEDKVIKLQFAYGLSIGHL